MALKRISELADASGLDGSEIIQLLQGGANRKATLDDVLTLVGTLLGTLPKRDTAANLASANPVLNAGQRGTESDTGRSKVGDGATAWNSLYYIGANDIPYASRTTSLLVNTSTDTAGVWSSAVTAPASVPSGATEMLCAVSVQLSGSAILAVERASGVTLTAISSGSDYYLYRFVRNQTGTNAQHTLWVPLDASKQFKWCTYSSSSTVIIGPPIAFRWGE